MKFKSGTRRKAIEYEKAIAAWWKENKTFERSVEQRPAENSYVFYDGPPFITGVPHHGTLLSSIVKDAVPRYWTMKGKRVERVWGWDCHGLPAENFVEKQLGIVDRRQIITDENAPAPLDKEGNPLPTITLQKYIETARESMVANSETWEPVIDRIGRWVDFKNAYRTMDKDFMESVWWAFKKLYDAGKIYEGEKVLMYDTKFATPVSKNEVTMDNDAYQTVTDPSVYVKFCLTDESIGDKTRKLGLPVYFLAWTTTPWTLPGNTALAVNPDMTYSEIRVGDEIFILAKDLIDKVLIDEKKKPFEYEVIHDVLPGAKLVGKSYEPLMRKWLDYDELFADKMNQDSNENLSRDNFAKVWAADYVGSDSGTGIVHIAPIYGEEDFSLASEKKIPRLHVLDDDGIYLDEVARGLSLLFNETFGANFHEILKKSGVKMVQKFAKNVNNFGKEVEEIRENYEVFSVNKMIAKALAKSGTAWKIEMIRHEYPFNPRSKQRIMYRAIPSWFFDIQNSKPLMLEQNENINWFPEHLKHGRFAKNIEQAPDWNLSRDRFWATAMPVWKGDRGTVKVVGSYDELYELSGKKLDDYHRPWIDEITFEIDGEKFTRIDKVLDCWFESGSMPFAQLHYPFENQTKFEQNYPADFITEYMPQVRAWFYYVHTINTALAEIGAFGDKCKEKTAKNAFNNVVVSGTLAGNDGRKMSKSLGNFTDPNELMDEFSADSLRFLLLSSPLLNGEDFALKDKDVSDVARKLGMIWNMYDFFTMYAEVDGWEYNPAESSSRLLRGSETEDSRNETENDILTTLKNPLDRWIVSRYRQLRDHITKFMDEYNLPDAMSAILPFVDDASNWFVRRSRRRFWKSEDDADKNDAYKTLHYVLRHLSYVLAPFTPFLAEELYQKLTGGESVHLLDWPSAGEVDGEVLRDMARTREIIERGLALRMRKDDARGEAAIKIRQPLQFVSYAGEKLDDFYEQIMADELNVKEVRHVTDLRAHLENYDEVDGEIRGETWTEISKKLTPELKREGLSREVIRFVQNARKKAGLNVDDRIILELATDNAELQKAIDEWREVIMAETLAVDMFDIKDEEGYATTVRIDSAELKIALKKEE